MKTKTKCSHTCKTIPVWPKEQTKRSDQECLLLRLQSASFKWRTIYQHQLLIRSPHDIRSADCNHSLKAAWVQFVGLLILLISTELCVQSWKQLCPKSLGCFPICICNLHPLICREG